MQEQERERLVKTPWFEEDIPLTRAAEIGTRKVIRDHSTIGLVVTADGSFGDLKRDSYIQAEKTAVSELKAIGKFFLILLARILRIPELCKRVWRRSTAFLLWQ